jgi:hypothetical protein
LTELEKVEAKHTLVCPNIPKIRALEDNQLESKSVKKWIIATVGIGGTIMMILWILAQMYMKAHGI